MAQRKGPGNLSVILIYCYYYNSFTNKSLWSLNRWGESWKGCTVIRIWEPQAPFCIAWTDPAEAGACCSFRCECFLFRIRCGSREEAVTKWKGKVFMIGVQEAKRRLLYVRAPCCIWLVLLSPPLRCLDLFYWVLGFEAEGVNWLRLLADCALHMWVRIPSSSPV